MNKGKAILVIVVMMAAALCGAGWLLWGAVQQVSPAVARGWALVVTALLPLTGWAGWRLGHLEARGYLDGIDLAIGRVMGAASKTADLRGYTARSVRQPKRLPEVPQTKLPDVTVIARRMVEDVRMVEL